MSVRTKSDLSHSFATTQAAYEKNFVALFEAMDRVEAILAKSRYLTGDKLTLADIRLWTTLVRFDPVYYGMCILCSYNFARS